MSYAQACLIAAALAPLDQEVALGQDLPHSVTPMQPAAATDVDILSAIATNPDLSTFYRAVTLAGMGSYLRAAKTATVFAPSNAAFAKWPAEDLERLMAYPPALQTLIEFHISEAAITYREAQDLDYIVMLTSSLVSVDFADNHLWINDALVVRHDLRARNGIIHVIDTVLRP